MFKEREEGGRIMGDVSISQLAMLLHALIGMST